MPHHKLQHLTWADRTRCELLVIAHIGKFIGEEYPYTTWAETYTRRHPKMAGISEFDKHCAREVVTKVMTDLRADSYHLVITHQLDELKRAYTLQLRRYQHDEYQKLLRELFSPPERQGFVVEPEIMSLTYKLRKRTCADTISRALQEAREVARRQTFVKPSSNGRRGMGLQPEPSQSYASINRSAATSSRSLPSLAPSTPTLPWPPSPHTTRTEPKKNPFETDWTDHPDLEQEEWCEVYDERESNGFKHLERMGFVKAYGEWQVLKALRCTDNDVADAIERLESTTPAIVIDDDDIPNPTTAAPMHATIFMKARGMASVLQKRRKSINDEVVERPELESSEAKRAFMRAVDRELDMEIAREVADLPWRSEKSPETSFENEVNDRLTARWEKQMKVANRTLVEKISKQREATVKQTPKKRKSNEQVTHDLTQDSSGLKHKRAKGLSLPEMREACRALGLRLSGNKTQLRSRLEAFEAESLTAKPPAPPSPTPAKRSTVNGSAPSAITQLLNGWPSESSDEEEAEPLTTKPRAPPSAALSKRSTVNGSAPSAITQLLNCRPSESSDEEEDEEMSGSDEQ